MTSGAAHPVGVPPRSQTTNSESLRLLGGGIHLHGGRIHLHGGRIHPPAGVGGGRSRSRGHRRGGGIGLRGFHGATSSNYERGGEKGQALHVDLLSMVLGK